MKTCFFFWDSDFPYIQVLRTELWRSHRLVPLLHYSFLVNHHCSCQVSWNVLIFPQSTITPSRGHHYLLVRHWSFSNWFHILSVFPYNLLSTLKPYQAHAQPPSVTFHCLQEKVQAPRRGLEFVLNLEASACSLASSVPPFLTLMSSTSLKKACYFFSCIPLCYLPFPFLEFLCVISFSPSVLCLDVTSPRRHPLTTSTTGRTGPHPVLSLAPGPPLLHRTCSFLIPFWGISYLFDFKTHENREHVCFLYHCILISWHSVYCTVCVVYTILGLIIH